MGSPGVGSPGEKDFSEPLRLLVVADDDDQAARAAGAARRRTRGADVATAPPACAARCISRAVDCVVLALADGDDPEGAIRTVLSSVSDEPVVVHRDNDEGSALEAIHEGAQDYLLEPSADAGELDRAIRFAIVRKRTETRLSRQALQDPLTGLPNRALLLDRLQRRSGPLAPATELAGPPVPRPRRVQERQRQPRARGRRRGA